MVGRCLVLTFSCAPLLLQVLFDAAKELMNSGRFQTVLDPASMGCYIALPWWRPGSAAASTLTTGPRGRRRDRTAVARALQHGRRGGRGALAAG